LLASLDPANYIIAREIADANLDQAQDDYNRVSLMYQKKSIAESDFTKVTNALKAARAQQHLQAKNLDDTKLFSPITGVLLKKGTEVGEIVGTGIPVFVVSDIRTVKVNASIPESELHNIHMGGEAHVYIASLNSTCTGKVSEIGSLADAETRSFTVKIVLNNEGMHIRPGMTAEIIIPSGKVSSALLIPLESVLHETDQSVYVFVADKNLKMAYHRKISIGKIEGNNVEVLSGLNAGETIITQAQQKLSNGSLISIK